MRIYTYGIATIIAMATLGTSPALASSTETGSLTVTATLTAACSIGDGTLDFSSFTSIDAGTSGTKSNVADQDATSSGIAYVCSNGASPSLTLAGTNDSGSQFRMKHGTADYLPYNIYSDSGYSSELTNAGSLSLTGDGTNKTLTLYGRVPGATANKPIGDYTDTITMTVTY